MLSALFSLYFRNLFFYHLIHLLTFPLILFYVVPMSLPALLSAEVLYLHANFSLNNSSPISFVTLDLLWILIASFKFYIYGREHWCLISGFSWIHLYFCNEGLALFYVFLPDPSLHFYLSVLLQRWKLWWTFKHFSLLSKPPHTSTVCGDFCPHCGLFLYTP